MKRGSALLVVLGMLSFMLLSGLAFSVYMRQSRLPTSFLRRAVATRQLAKAALAEAIEEIDMAIGNDPHPNLHIGAYQSGVITNIWDHRVFFGVGTTSQQNGDNQQANAQNTYAAQVDPSKTVPTLTLEGLAYLPPNLINDVRCYSQLTPTAKWHSFWFDSGRYAYTAIDVSDYFDINRVYANEPRSSGNRISFAHLFETGGAEHSGFDEKNAKAWDSFLEQYRPDGGNMPLISMADFNIALGEDGKAGYKSPFRNLLKGTGKTPIYEKEDPSGEVVEKYRGMTFVTDGWFPTTTGNTTPVTKREKRDLTQYQPFRDADLNGSTMPSMANMFLDYSSGIVNAGDNGADLSQHLCGLGLVQLWDYLDANRVPVSLAVPTLERVPMIVGIEPVLSETTVKVTCEQGTAPAVPAPAPAGTINPVTQTFTYKISLSGSAPGAKVMAAYPFRNHGIDDSANFSINGRMAIFLTVNGQEMSLRPGKANAGLHMTKSLMDGNENTVLENSIFSIALQSQTVTGEGVPKDEKTPVRQFLLQQKGSAKGLVDVEFFKVVYRWNMVSVSSGTSTRWEYQTINDAMAARGGSSLVPDNAQTTIGFKALASDGAVASEFSDATKFADLVDTIAQGIDVKLNAAVWAWVKHSDERMGGEKIVDLVPACVIDDDELNGAHNNGDAASQIGGRPYPLMRYDVTPNGDPTFNIKVQTASGTIGEYPLTIANPRIICNDPRYNHRPENWYVVAGSGLTEQDWIAETAKMLGNDGCDSDFYMFTSDAGYMQSVYELAFLPRLTGLTYETKGSPFWGSYLESQNAAAKERSTFGSSAADALDYNSMWRTYRCFASNGNAADPFEQIGLTCGENGQKVNPYSDSTKVLMAAFANTPHDWRVTATNEKYAVISESEMTDAATFNAAHAWNDYSSDESGKLRWDCLEAIAKEFRIMVSDSAVQAAAEANGVSVWEEAFAQLHWSASEKKIIDFSRVTPKKEETDSLMYSVDKKFLYGFWHDCFAARQQLFLIFVRAEPMMMGGGLSGQVPPQLSARAVALVWRDPTATTGTRSVGDEDAGEETKTLPNPHRTRILFYHQFD